MDKLEPFLSALLFFEQGIFLVKIIFPLPFLYVKVLLLVSTFARLLLLSSVPGIALVTSGVLCQTNPGIL